MDKLNIHLTGICGIAMGTLALMFKDMGFNITGSDNEYYPPMSINLENSGISLFEEFNAKNVNDQDIVIIGNSISRGNVEAEEVLNNNIPYLSMAGALYNFFLKGKEVISVSGTHGKSTTSALLAHILDFAGESPSFFIGASLLNYNSNYKLGKGNYFVIEGDEYDSAFFEKFPKFIFYRPDHLILTSLEFDHADIYNDIDEIEIWFRRLVNNIPSKGHIVYSKEYENLKNIILNSFSKNSSIGFEDADFLYKSTGFIGDNYNCNIVSGKYGELNIQSRIFGDFNCSNIAAAASMALLLGIDKELVLEGIKNFSGIRRRQELIHDANGILIYEDFAHHPTAIKMVINSMKEKYPDARLWAVYEPRSATSRRNVFQPVLPLSFKNADETLFKNPCEIEKIDIENRLNIIELKKQFNRTGVPFNNFDNVENIIEYICSNIDPEAKNVILIMSNGGFDGIYDKIIRSINNRFYETNINP